MNRMSIKSFLDNELCDYAKYSTIRAIPSCIDGLKNSGRKIIFSAQTELNKETKVSVFSGIAQLKTQYLHGDISDSVVKLARNFCGSNNLPLLKASGNFGTRMLPEASATRYIFTEKQPYFNKIINPLDNDILISQEFEGESIEPRFFVPTLPILLLNGSQGVATGFSSTILPRNPEKVLECILKYLKTSKIDETLLSAWFKGFKGEVIQEGNKVTTKGVWTIEKNQIIITEIPIGYNLLSYKKILDKLEDDKVIKSYEDKSDDDNFIFIIKAEKSFLSKNTKDIEAKLGLSKVFSENYTCIDVDNNIIVFSNVSELFKYYVDIKLEYLQKRKENIIKKKTILLKELSSEFLFIKKVINDEINLKTLNKKDIIEILEKEQKIVKKQNSYEYLLRIPVLNLTPDKMKELKDKILELKTEIDSLQEKTPENIWEEDLESLKGLVSE